MVVTSRALRLEVVGFAVDTSALHQLLMSAHLRDPAILQDDDQIRALHASGYSPEQICAVIDRRPRSLVRHMEYLGLVEGSAPVQGLERAGTPWRMQDEEELRALFASGIDADEIAARMHRTRYSIACRLEKLGLIEDREQLRK